MASLALPFHRLRGPFSLALEEHFLALKGLTELHLVGNQLSGEMPESISQMRGLRILLLRDNRLTGNIPFSISELQALVVSQVLFALEFSKYSFFT